MNKIILVLSLFFSSTIISYSAETMGKKALVKKNEAIDQTKSKVRDIDDKTCEMVHGKLRCFGKKVIHKTKSATEQTGTKVKEIKNKID